MGLDDLRAKLTKAGHAAEGYITQKWEEAKRRDNSGSYDPEAAARAELQRRIDGRNALLRLIYAKRTGSSAVEMPVLEYDPRTDHKAVLLVTIPIRFGRFKLSQTTYDLLAKHVGMSLSSVSHWALAVIDRSFGPCYCYDLMSDQLELAALGKNYFRVTEITPEYVAAWSSCYYVGETTKSHEVIQELGRNHMIINPRYRLLTSNCQDLVENLVLLLCNGKIISQAKLKEELSLASPRIALDLMIARLRSKMEVMGEHEDSDTVQEDVDTIKGLWHRAH